MSAWDLIYADLTATMSTPVALFHLAMFAFFAVTGLILGWVLRGVVNKRGR